MTDQVIEVAVDWREIDPFRLGARLSDRYFSAHLWPSAVVGGLLVFGLLFRSFDVANRGGPQTLVAVAAGVAAYWLVMFLPRRRLKRDMRAAPYRQGIDRLILSPEGIARAGGPGPFFSPWSHVTDVFADETGLVLAFSPLEAQPLPDKGLPEGMTRADLAEAIARWREAT